MSDEGVTIYGASDDLIEIEGDIREEFYYREDALHDEGGMADGDLLVFSDGTALRIYYDGEGVWRISAVHHGTASMTLRVCPGDDGKADYSDRCTLNGDLTWVIHGNQKARRD